MAFINPNLLPPIDATFDADGDASWGAVDENVFSYGSDTQWWLSSPKSFKFTNDTADPTSIGPARMPATEGTRYVFYVPIRTSSTQTGITQTLTLTWFTADDDDATTGTPATFTTPLTGDPESAFLSANIFNVFGLAPAGATYVQPSITITGLPARTDVWVDSVYFGELYEEPGQLLPPAEASFENGSDDWTATGADLSRGNYTAGNGNYCLRVSATDAAVAVESGTYIPTTPGTNLVGHLYMYSPDSSESATLGMRWYDSSHTALSDSTVPVDVTTVGSFVYYVITGTAPANAAYARIIMSYAATAGESRYVDNMFLAVATVDADNLLTYEQSTFEAAFPAWTVANGTIAQTPLQLGGIDSAHSAKITPDGSGQIVSAAMDERIAITAGKNYKLSASIGRRSPGTDTSVSVFRPNVTMYDIAGVPLGVGTDQWVSESSDLAVAFWNVFAEFTAPTGAVSLSVETQIDPSDSTLIDWYFIDNLKLFVSEPDMTAVTDDATGRIDISILWPDDVNHPRDGYLSVRRIDQDGAATYVRTVWGDSSALKFDDTGTPVVLEDYEAPLGTEVWYLAEFFDASGGRERFLQTESFASPVLDSDYVWLKSPGQPAYQTKLVPETSFSWTRAARNAAYDIVGRTNPVVWSDVRAGRQSTASFLALDTASHVQLDALLGLGTPVLIQAMPGLGADGNHYFVVGDVGPEPVNSNAALEGWRWTIDLTEIDRPSGAIQGSAGSTWQDLLDEGGTWLDEITDGLTWADLLTD